MKIPLRPLMVLGLVPTLPAAARPAAGGLAPELAVRFSSPATAYTESCPVGNGRLGAMIFGNPADERIVLNETGVWSGSPHDTDRPDAHRYLPEIRRLLFAGKNVEAQALAQEHFTSLPLVPVHPVSKAPGRAPGVGSETTFGCYQTLGSLELKFDLPSAATTGYSRELDLGTALSRTRFQSGGITFTAEALASAPDDIIAVHYSADRPGRISFTLGLDRPEKFTTVAAGDDGLLMTGQLENGTDGQGVRYAARVRAVARGGQVSTEGNRLRVSGADEVTLYVDGLTDIHTFAGRRADDPAGATAADLAKVVGKSYDAIRRDQAADYRKLFDRAGLELGPAFQSAPKASTWERLQAAARGKQDPGLIALYFNFGRYLLISSSRPGGLPPNLQGLWADEVQTAWNGDWHLDVNVQMNYWSVNVCNLAELDQPYFALIASLQKPGARTARLYYGARGWVAHMFTNPWGFTSPGNLAGWGMFQTGGAWACQELWDHYVYTKDRRYLAWAYPILRGAALFYCDALVEEPKTKYLVTAPANSPENPFLLPDGAKALDSMGTTMDMQLVRHLFDGCIAASEILGVDEPFRAELKEKRARLVPTRIGPDGRIMEWLEPYTEADVHHRHISHMWGLYPGTEITPDETPALAVAARKSLDVRGDYSMGWSLAFKTGLWARLQDGERALGALKMLLRPCDAASGQRRDHSGAYANLFDACPPFQIDANLGAPAAIAEMLLQSREPDSGGHSNSPTLLLLPALPWEWQEGSVHGLCTRGGFTVDLDWKAGRLVSAAIHGTADTACTVRCAGRSAGLTIANGATVRLGPDLQVIDLTR
jgi:alpha-L-fucosidase 2